MNIVEIAQQELAAGVREVRVNSVKYNDWFYGHHVEGVDFPWCAVFVSWCAWQAGVPESVVPKTASTTTLRNFFKSQGTYKDKSSGYRPVAGDIMLLDGHTGIVVGSDSNKFYTIDGNSSDKVSYRSYSYSYGKLYGWGHPNYGQTVTAPSGYDTGTDTSTGASVASLNVGTYDYSQYTVKQGDTLQSIATHFNVTTSVLAFVNNLSGEPVVGTVLSVPTAPGRYTWDESAKGATQITRRHTESYDIYHPTLTVAFFGEYGQLAITNQTMVADSGVAKDVISITTSRGMSQDCPTFAVTLVYRNDWYNALSSNDLVVIRMQRPPEAMATVMYGLVDDIRQTMDFSSGQPQRAIQVTGRGFNKAFVNFDVGFIKNISIDLGTGFFNGLMDLTSCDSYDAIKLSCNAYVGKGINYSFGNGKHFQDYFQLKGNHREGESLKDYTSFSTYSGSFWNFLKELGNTPFCETFWEIQDEKATLIHRCTPFNRDDWTALPTTTIKDSDIMSDSTGRSDLETYTVFSVQQSFMDDDMSTLFRPLWYPPNYSKYGISQLSVGTLYEIEGGTDPGSTMRQYFIDLFNWNIKNPVMANGTITVKGHQKYKVGQRVILESSGIEYYVEGVNHSFTMYGSWTTDLQVTRGILPTRRFTPPWGEYEEMTDSVMTAITQQTAGTKIDWANLPKVNYSTSSTAASGATTQQMSADGIVSGNLITLPAGMGSIYTYMGWQCITARSSQQYKLRAAAGQNFDSNGFGIINDRYVVACTSTFGKIGDYLTVTLNNGQVIQCIVGDEKRQTDAGACKWGHEGGKSVIEFIVDKNSWYGTSRTVLKFHPEWKGTTTKSVLNTGNYWG